LLWKRENSGATDVNANNGAAGPSGQGGGSEEAGEGKLRQKWEAVICASQPGTDVEKFQRLMGMKKAPPQGPSPAPFGRDISTNPQNMAASAGNSSVVEQEKERQQKASVGLERQYEQARSTTHFGYRRGLGF